MPVSLVLWDWNGTLLDDVALGLASLNRNLARFGYPQQYTLAEYREIFTFPIEDYYALAGFDFPAIPMKFWRRHICRIICPPVKAWR